ncbi:MAG: hypothetical protein A2086_04825 [Spirochaetes bacterium GWD1_27_9]|nr:MAG: hypothetical protein A2Z98_04240 [Spirochaetes bacterium GWB1_27_13]OHD27629.1 MAG: hypothetical protein A2Y34_00280 [Spirochaetes bacterium GWC1_27_15]OHD31939.1 MAG: hypothetical protein A2086_04825 [Spirochaetes bacterium GWD1_27_9]
MSKHIDIVPIWLRIIIGFLALMNIAFGVMGYFDMSVLFNNGAGLNLSNTILKNASFEFAAKESGNWIGIRNCSC